MRIQGFEAEYMGSEVSYGSKGYKGFLMQNIHLMQLKILKSIMVAEKCKRMRKGRQEEEKWDREAIEEGLGMCLENLM